MSRRNIRLTIRFSLSKSIFSTYCHISATKRLYLTYKAEWNGKKVVKIDRYFPSSQTCNVCGYVNKQTKDFSVREWECPVCHTHHNRDVNAAINILRFGLNHISAGTVDYTGGEGVRTNLLKGRSSAKPEAHESLARG